MMPLGDVLRDVVAVQHRMDAFVEQNVPSRLSTPVSSAPADKRFQGFIRQGATESGVDPALLEAVIAGESAFDPQAVSARGARGLMQLMPATAAALGVRDPSDPLQNIRGGARYLRSLLDRFGGDVRLALAAYNAGPGAVERYGGIPPYKETQAYVEEVSATYDMLSGVRRDQYMRHDGGR